MPQYECPSCRKRTTVADANDAPWRPFCCQRCKLVDLGRWLDGTYCIPEETPERQNAKTPRQEHDDPLIE